MLPRSDNNLARALQHAQRAADARRSGADRRRSRGSRDDRRGRARGANIQSCERERSLLALDDLAMSFQQLTRARQPRQRQLLSDRPARTGGVRRADWPGPPAWPGRRCADPAPATGRPARARRRDRRHRRAQYQHRAGAATAADRHRLVLPVGLRLDQPEARRALPPAYRAGEATGGRGPRAARISRADGVGVHGR